MQQHWITLGVGSLHKFNSNSPNFIKEYTRKMYFIRECHLDRVETRDFQRQLDN